MHYSLEMKLSFMFWVHELHVPLLSILKLFFFFFSIYSCKHKINFVLIVLLEAKLTKLK